MNSESFRVGIVSSADPAKCTAKVYFEELDDSVSYDLKVLVRNTTGAKDFWIPNVGEAVVCLFLDNGIETGFILGSFYNDIDKP